jgi:hypothetical protein
MAQAEVVSAAELARGIGGVTLSRFMGEWGEEGGEEGGSSTEPTSSAGTKESAAAAHEKKGEENRVWRGGGGRRQGRGGGGGDRGERRDVYCGKRRAFASCVNARNVTDFRIKIQNELPVVFGARGLRVPDRTSHGSSGGGGGSGGGTLGSPTASPKVYP